MGMKLVTIGSLYHQAWHGLGDYSSVEQRDQKTSGADFFKHFPMPEGGKRKYLKSKDLGLEGGQVTGVLAHSWSRISLLCEGSQIIFLFMLRKG